MIGCENRQNKKNELQIVTSIPPLFSLTANIIEGTPARLTNLVPGNASEHSWQMTSSSAANVEKADLIIINGAGLETYLEDFLKDKKEKMVVASEGVKLITITSGGGSGTDDREERTSASGDGVIPNPHIWLDPANAKIMAKNISQALEKKDPTHETVYQKNTENLIAKLDELSAEIQTRLDALSIEPFMEFHDAYPYFDRAFGLKPAAVIELTPGETPSPKYLQYLLNLMEEKSVRAIFTEPQLSPKILDLFRESYDFKVDELDPVGQELSSDGYFIMMRKNAEAFERTFKKT
ncbi:zinc ABC transporter substrate-binding protein [Candidatus Peregrinibacteria bacterium]|nr:zinc ABC transporter substrate-binding protein [Candidatus Peregrinibacteria bacterium]